MFIHFIIYLESKVPKIPIIILSYLNFSDPLPETNLYLFGLITILLHRVKSGSFGHQVNSDIYLQTVEILFRSGFSPSA